jgi:hypothetical protein
MQLRTPKLASSAMAMVVVSNGFAHIVDRGAGIARTTGADRHKLT